MQSKVIKNIFSEDQIIKIKTLRDSMTSISVSKRWPGREVKPLSNLELLPEGVIEKLSSIATESYGKQLSMYAVAFGRYSKQFGIPKLGPHMDEVPSQFTLDYQLDGNISWPLNVEGEEFLLNNNDALIFEGEKVLHWRPKREFVDGEFLDLLWFQFIDKNHWGHTKELMPDYAGFKKNLFEKKKQWGAMYDGL